MLSPRPASLTSGALKKEGTLRGAVNVMPGPECKWSTTETGAPCGTDDSSGRLAPVFVYGTLKTGQPNHRVLLDGAHGRAAFRGRAHTLEPYPLVIAGEHNIPRLLNLPGRGHRVFGEVYEVDERMLRFLDEFESCPDMYQRTRLRGPGGRTRALGASSTPRLPTRQSGSTCRTSTITTRRGSTGSATTRGKTDEPSGRGRPGTSPEGPRSLNEGAITPLETGT